MPDQDFIDRLGHMVGLNGDVIQDRLADLDVDDILSLVDAVGHDKIDTARALIGSPTAMPNQDEADDPGEAVDVADHDEDVESGKDDTDVDADVTSDEPIHPLLTRQKSERSGDTDTDDTVEEGSNKIDDLNIGDTVRFNGHKAVVKVPHGPGDTVGILIDGENTMVDRGALRRKRVEEGVLGMSPMLDLRRMQELAGLAPTAEQESNSSTTQGHFVDLPVEEIDQETVTCGSNHVPTSDTSIADGTDTMMGMDDIMDAIDQIERLLPDLRIRDAKDLRKRIDRLVTSINETAFVRRRKL